MTNRHAKLLDQVRGTTRLRHYSPRTCTLNSHAAFVAGRCCFAPWESHCMPDCILRSLGLKTRSSEYPTMAKARPVSSSRATGSSIR